MCSAALSPWEQMLSAVRRSRGLAASAVFTLTGACSIYSSDLLSATSDVTNGGGDIADAGHTSSAAGMSNSAGGKLAVDVPGGGGDGDSAEPSSGATSEAGKGGGFPSTGGSAGTSTTAGNGSGTAGSAGTTGSGGSAGSAGGPATGTGDLLDGFEDEDLTLEQTSGRGGVWYLFNDMTVGTDGPTPLVCSPLAGAPADLGLYAMHITATGFTGFGSGLGVDFRAGKKVYDASKFTGIRFWAKVGVGKNTKHRVQIADSTTDVAGGKCNAAAAAPNGEKCDDHFGVNATFTTSWAQYVIRFDQMAQLGWGLPAAAITKAAVYGLQVTAKPKLEVDLWLDQIEFF